MPSRIGKYSVIRKIASGGMGDIYLCRFRGEEGFQKKVAVKIINPRLSETTRFRELFAHEARIAASLSHPNLIQVFDFGKEGQSLFLAMEYIDGWNLAHAISQSRALTIPFPLPVWRFWMEGILAALGYLHSRGIIHRDISPSNVLLSRGGAVKVTDFGIARAALQGIESDCGWEGKMSYMSPEQARGEGADESSDLFAAAIISAELYLPGRLIDGGTPREILSRLQHYNLGGLDIGKLPATIAEVVKKGLSERREDRYANADQFGRAICDAVPSAAGRAELQACWSRLFPENPGEEETIVAESLPDEDVGMVRERRSTYGERGARLLKAGILSAIAAASVGSWMIWKEVKKPGTADDRAAEILASDPVRPSADIPAVETRPVSRVPAKKPAGSGVASTTAKSPETLQRAVVVVTEPAGVAVTLEDGTPLGKTPTQLDLAPWKGKNILFRMDGYEGKSVPANVLAEFKTFRLEMERQMGTIEVIQAIPWAKVFDGERYLGDTPIHRLELPSGPHRLRFINEPLGIEHFHEVTIHPGVNPKIILPLVGKSKGE